MWYGEIVDNKLFVNEEFHGKEHNMDADGNPMPGAKVLDFWPEDCERLEWYYQANKFKERYWSDVFQFAQYLYEADVAKAKFNEPDDEFDDDIPF
jgi:hypothetical protein